MAAVMLANIKIAHPSSQEIAGQMTHEQNAKNYVRIRHRFDGHGLRGRFDPVLGFRLPSGTW